MCQRVVNDGPTSHGRTSCLNVYKKDRVTETCEYSRQGPRSGPGEGVTKNRSRGDGDKREWTGGQLDLDFKRGLVEGGGGGSEGCVGYLWGVFSHT